MATRTSARPPTAGRACPWTEAAFDAVVERHLRALRRTAVRIVGCEDLAMEAVQDALVSLWQHHEIPDRVGSWLDRAVTLRSLHTARSKRRRQRVEGSEELRRLRPIVHEGETEAAQVEQEVRREIDALSPRYREVVTLRHVEGLEYAEVAERIGVPIGTVRSRLARARAQLEERLRDLAMELGCHDHTDGTCRRLRS